MKDCMPRDLRAMAVASDIAVELTPIYHSKITGVVAMAAPTLQAEMVMPSQLKREPVGTRNEAMP